MDDGNEFRLGREAAERYDAVLGPIMAPFVEAVLEATGVGAGDHVLDVACGTGFVAAAARARTGSTGRVVGCDLNPAMLAVAADPTATRDESIEWVQSPGDQLPFDADTFDVVVCQQGLQFMPDLDATFTATAKVLRPAGRFASTTWSSLDQSPYMAAQHRALADAIGPAATESFLAAFALTADELARAAEGAGFVDVTVAEIAPEVTLPALPTYAAQHLAALPWGRAVAAIGPDAIGLVAQAITDQLGAYSGDDGTVRVPFASHLLTAKGRGQ